MKIELIPAIDIIGGKCVRLTKGDYSQKKVYNEDPVSQAREFERLGFKRLHVVDLDGAKAKHIVNDAVLRGITAATSLKVDFGGGIKSEEDIEKAFAAGAAMVTVGSIAVSQPQTFLGWLKTYGAEKMILGADVRNGFVSINGWKEDSKEELLPFLTRYVEAGVKNVLCTDISKDGAMQGTNRSLYRELSHKLKMNIIASGGVSSIEDIRALRDMELYGAVIGRAYYTGAIKISEALEVAK